MDTSSIEVPSMPLWLKRIGEHPPGLPPLDAIPMAILEPHRDQAMRNHGQTLDQLRDRGGLSVCEAVAIMEDRPWKPIPFAVAVHRLADLIQAAPR